MSLLAAAAWVALLQADTSPTENTFVRARNALDAELIDYPAARFRDVRASRFRICGYVNGRNRMGGFAGWDRFLVSLLPETTVVRFESADKLGMVRMLCDGEGAPPTSPDYSARMTDQPSDR